jgi:hypothetical protein
MSIVLYVVLGLIGGALGLLIAGYAGYIMIRIVAQTLRRVFLSLEDVSALWVHEIAFVLAEGIMTGLGLLIYCVVKLIRLIFWPLRKVWGTAKKARDEDLRKRWGSGPLPANPVKEARDILGLPDQFTAADLKERHRDLIRRVHTDTGGTDWLSARVNWARDVLEQAV